MPCGQIFSNVLERLVLKVVFFSGDFSLELLACCFVDILGVVQFEEAWAVNHAVGRSSLSCAKLTKGLQQAINPKYLGLSFPGLNLKVLYTTIISLAR